MKQQSPYPRRFYTVMKIRVLFILMLGLILNLRSQAAETYAGRNKITVGITPPEI